jgi:hypothetical protein
VPLLLLVWSLLRRMLLVRCVLLVVRTLLVLLRRVRRALHRGSPLLLLLSNLIHPACAAP